MKRISTILLFIFLYHTGFTQSWIQENNNPNTKSGRTRNRAFVINGTAYVLGGSDDYNYYGTEAWAFDTTTKSWSAVAPYPDATGDDGKSAVTVDSLGYAGFGGAGALGVWENTWFSYSKTLNKWTALAPFPGAARGYAATVTIGGIIYIAGGENGTNNHGNDDFYRYNPATNTWRRIGVNCPALGVNFASVAFAINGKGYVCTGALIDSLTGTYTAQSDVWEYDPSDSTWTQKNPFPGGARMEAMGWATCDKGYLGGGYAIHSPQTLDSDFWEYSPGTDTWTQIANYGGGNLNGAATFVIGNTGYVCGGQRDSANFQQARGYVWTDDMWSYTKLYTPAFTTTTPVNICLGQSVSFTDTSTYSPDHWYWQFPGGTPNTDTTSNPTVVYDTAGIHNVILTAWNNCDSSSQTFTNYITVTTFPDTIQITPIHPLACNGQSIILKAYGGTGAFYQWVGTTDTTDSIVIQPSKDTTYELTVASGNCSKDTLISVIVNNPSPLVITPASPSICSGQSITLTADTTGGNYTWVPGTGLAATTGDSVIANPTITITYTVTGTDSIGCTVSGTDILTVSTGPNKPIITISVTGDTLFSSARNGNQWYVNGKMIKGATDSIYVITGLPKDTFKVEVTDIANGCSTTSDSVIAAAGIYQLSINNNQLSVYPNPTNGTITVTINSSVVVYDCSLFVTNVLGQTLYNRLSLNYTNEIDLSKLPGGVYFITIKNKTGQVVVPVVKQN